jgi:hypothetical protein
MDWSQAHLIYEEVAAGKDEVIEKIDNDWCEDCDIQMIQTGKGFDACPMCGACNCLDAVFVPQEAWVKRQSMYKRRLYCQEKLRLLTCQKICNSQRYKKLVKRLKKLKVKNLVVMKQYLKEWGCRGLYKYIYGMYRDVTGKKLVAMTSQQIGRLSTEFVKMEVQFRMERGERKNFYNYSSVIYLLMRKHKIPGYKHIVLPLNYMKIRREMKALMM